MARRRHAQPQPRGNHGPFKGARRSEKLLSDGNDPETGKPFPPNSPYQRPDIIRALFHAVRVLESGATISEAPATNEKKPERSA